MQKAKLWKKKNSLTEEIHRIYKEIEETKKNIKAIKLHTQEIRKEI